MNNNRSEIKLEIAVIIESIAEGRVAQQPWIYFKDALAERNIHIHIYQGNNEPFKRSYDAMILHVWLDWGNKERFDPGRILPIMEKYAVYRAEFPETVQIILNETDMSRRPYATPYWRSNDPILYRTPAYNRNELYPFPPEHIWPYEVIWGKPCLISTTPNKYTAGFIGQPNGPAGYRERVAKETAKVGVGICKRPRPYSNEEYNNIISNCEIIVCPRGWGEQSQRHWDAWLSGKPVLTDRECDSVEMIPGFRLKHGIHYLVFDKPDEIPDIVSDWTRPSRRDDLRQIAENGKQAALSYDGFSLMTTYFNKVIKKNKIDNDGNLKSVN